MNRHPRGARHEACSESRDFFLNGLTSENKVDEKRQDQQPHEERRKAREHYKGDERRAEDQAETPPKKYSSNEMPPDPTPGNPGKEASIERDRLDRGDKKGSEEH